MATPQKFVSEHGRGLQRADEYGRVLANMLRDEGKDASIPREFWAHALAAMSDNLTEDGIDRQCASNLIQWQFERFWGLKTEQFLPEFRSVWEQLVDRDIFEDNALVYNDLDYTIWVEPHPTRKIIVFRDIFTSRKDNVYLFILDDSVPGFSRFHIRTVYDKAKKIKNYNFGDLRDWAHMSIGTHRKFQWKMMYGDSRDHGYVLSYDEFRNLASYDLNHHHMEHAMWLIGTARCELENENNDLS